MQFKLFKRKVPAFKLQSVEPFEGERLDRLIALVSLHDFSLFLEYLDFTAQESSFKLSTMNLNDPQTLQKAQALQAYMAGIQSVADIAKYLKTLKEDKQHDRK